MDGSALIEERYKLLFEQQMKKYDKQVTLLKDTIQALAMEFQSIKAQVSDMQQLKAQMAAAPRRAEAAQKVLPSENKPASHPRQGNYTPEDVDIKKMFYFGHK